MDEQCISFVWPSDELYRLTDEEFLQRIQWRDTAAASLVRACQQADVRTCIRKWSKSLAGRARPKKSSGKHQHSTVLWSRYAFSNEERKEKTVSLLEALFRGQHTGVKSRNAIRSAKAIPNGPRSNPARKRARYLMRIESSAESWLADVRHPSTVTPFELLSLFDILLNFSSSLDDQLVWKLWRIALSAALDYRNNLDEPMGSQVTPDQRLLISGEVPWQLGLLFADVEGAPEFARSGRKTLCRTLLDGTDTDGTPDAELLERLPLWLAPLVRAGESAARFERTLFSKAALSRFECLIEVVAPMCRLNGQIALSNGSSHDVISLLQTASKVAGFRKNEPTRRYLARVASQTGHLKTGKKSAVDKTYGKRNWPVTQSDWAQLACLRNHWSFAANSLVVAHHGHLPLIDLSIGGNPILSGEWGIELHCDGKAVPISDDWQCVCWHSDEDADYLELQLTIDDKHTISRQTLLSRKDDFAILADVVHCAGARRIACTSRLPLVEGIQTVSSIDSRECVLKGRRKTARVFPLALPQDRVLSTQGGFGPFANDLVLKQVSAAGCLYAPVVIDWNSRRRRAETQWRTLTVTEARAEVGAGAASAHRLQIGEQHLFIYRSLRQPKTPRAVLGQHILHESLVGKFDRSGDVAPILVVES